ncbi:MAG TPA: class I SAM-dependent methyltransferase [Phycisphaerae bacterium]|nr:class I SAM-dependent methyltransferase [Phycisphaerae bacterium]
MVDTLEHTEKAYDFLWDEGQDVAPHAEIQRISREWLLERYCDGDSAVVDRWLGDQTKIILDAGCGVGHSALGLFGGRLRGNYYVGVDLSATALRAARQRFRALDYPGVFVNCDLMHIPLLDESADIVLAEGVMHHTDSVRAAMAELTRKLKPGGLFLGYVYAKKGPAREFTDDHIRQAIAEMSDEDAWKALMPLTKLGIALGELDCEVDVPEDVPLLGIPKGRVSIQRLIYWHFCKMFYRPEYTFEECHRCNADWFRPLNCHRHTPDEVRKMCDAAGLNIERMHIEEAGITIVARKGEQ